MSDKRQHAHETHKGERFGRLKEFIPVIKALG